MIHVDSIATALYDRLSTLTTSGYTVELGQPLRNDPAFVPWIGVYADDMVLEARRLSSVTPWTAVVELQVVLQHCSIKSAHDAAMNLYSALKPVLTAVNSDLKLGNTVQNIREISMAPQQRAQDKDRWFLTNVLVITAEVDG